jgi:hypothetical protein
MSLIQNGLIAKFVKNQVLNAVTLCGGAIRLNFKSGEWLTIAVKNYRISDEDHLAVPCDSSGRILQLGEILERPENPDPTTQVLTTEDDSFSEEPQSVSQTPQEKSLQKKQDLKVLCRLGDIPNGSLVTKRIGDKLYQTSTGIRIYSQKNAGEFQRIEPPAGCTFLCAEYSTFNCVSNDTQVHWVVSREDFLKHLDTNPLPY